MTLLKERAGIGRKCVTHLEKPDGLLGIQDLNLKIRPSI